MTFHERFTKYIKSVDGKSIDWDGVYGVQCCDLANHYIYNMFGLKTIYPPNFNAQQYFTRFSECKMLKDNFVKISNTPDFVPTEGDIAVFKSPDNIGHIAICDGMGTTWHFYSYDQNYNGKPCKRVTHTYKNFLGVLRHKSLLNISDTTGVKVGDKNEQVYNLKCLLRIAKYLNIQPYKVDNNNIFGKGTEKAVNYLLKAYGYEPNSIAGRKLVSLLTETIIDKMTI